MGVNLSIVIPTFNRYNEKAHSDERNGRDGRLVDAGIREESLASSTTMKNRFTILSVRSRLFVVILVRVESAKTLGK